MNKAISPDPSEGIFKYSNEGILIVDDAGKIIRVNPASERIFGFKEQELLGMTIESLIPARFRHKHPKHRASFHKDAKARSMGSDLQLFALKADKTEFPVEISLSPFSDGEKNFVIAFVVDISVRREAENKLIAYKNELEKEVEERTLDLRSSIQNLEQTKNDLDEALRREQELGSMKSRFVSIASHEFRTPLATIMSSLSLVEKYANLNQVQKRDRHISRIKTAVKNLTEILNDFLSLNRLEEGKVIFIVENFDVYELLDESVSQMKSLTKHKQHINLKVSGETNFRSDPRLINNILINLLSNAIKFSDEGKDIWVNVENHGHELIIKVNDEGIGMPKSEQKHVFERFYRMSNAGEIQGTGLGLSIVSHYVNLLSGKIEFKSIENEGTRFIISIPNNTEDENITN